MLEPVSEGASFFCNKFRDHEMMDCFTLVFLSGLLVLFWDKTAGVGCYKCKSVNGSDAGCGDPFHPMNNTYYHRLCNDTMPKRFGLFPMKYCLKIKGVNVRTDIEVIFRSCGNQIMDNTCGPFVLQGETYHGCIMSCPTHGCNSVPHLHPLRATWSRPTLAHVTAGLWTVWTLRQWRRVL